MARRKQGYVIKQSQEFIEYMLQNVTLDEKTGRFFSKVYCSTYVSFAFKGNTVSMPTSHLTWLIKYGKWPKDKMHIDHIDDNPLNNRPDNLQEITEANNQAKRRGKGNSYYGSTKYGHGISVSQDRRDGRYYIRRYFSSAKEINFKDRRLSLGGFSTLEEAEQYITEYIKNIDNPLYGLDWDEDKCLIT